MMDFSSTGALKSPFSPRVRQSVTGRRPIGLGSAKKNQSKYLQSTGESSGDVVYKTPTATLETYGAPLPVMVTEALFAGGEVTVRLSPCGWCWVVSGRRVVCWPRTPTTSSTASPAPSSTIARELTLPQTDLAHKSDLVVLFYEDEAQMPSCIGVSPEGTVRYWPSVGQEGVYVDMSCELAGQECDKLGEYTQEGLVLATTTCTVVLLNPTIVDGRSTVTSRTLRPPSGWLGGIGRRVSLLFFGSMPPQSDTKLVGVSVIPGEGDRESTIAVVCGGPTLQLWRGAELYEHDLRRPLLTLLPHHGDVSSIEVVALDVRAYGAGVLLLLATVNVARATDMRYAIAHVDITDVSAARVSWARPARGAESARAPRLLPLALHSQQALLYTHNYLTILSLSGANDKLEYIDVSSEGDRLLGAELCGGVPLLFSAKHGVLALSCSLPMPVTPSMCESPMGSPCPSDIYEGNLSLYEIDPHEVSSVTTDACGKLKTAFLFHVRRDADKCRDILRQLFPEHLAQQQDVDAVLDRTVLKIATEMLDDIPAGDPRWKQRGGSATNINLGSSAALQVAAQLRDKQRAFAVFVEFLRAVGLWQRLGLVTTEDGSVSSCAGALCALSERLAAAVALRQLQRGAHAQLIDAAVHQVVCGDNSDIEEEPEIEAALSSGALSASDVCYRRVSRIYSVLRALASAPAPAADTRAAPAHAAATLHVLTSTLSAVHSARAQWVSSGLCSRARPALHSRTLLAALQHLHKRAVTEYAHNCPEPNLRSQVYEAALALADLLLTDVEHLNTSPHTQPLYEHMRREAIQPFVEEGQLERAAALAEKFKDFELLVEMCYNAQDWERLISYIDKYSNEGIGPIAFAWLCTAGGAGRAALLRHVAPRCSAAASAWLRGAPGRAPLHALQLLHAQHHAPAALPLHMLAEEETHSVARLTTTASLAKLCLLTSESPAPEMCQQLEARLSLAEQHAALPRDIRVHNGLDTDDIRVYTPEELVQMYIESESQSLTEYDYKKALDLTDFVQDMERRDDLRLRVWCACVRRDSWATCRAAAPGDELHDKMFFRLVDLVHVMGGDLELLLPPVEDILTAPELAELVSDPRFHFIMKYGYECVDTSRNDRSIIVEG